MNKYRGQFIALSAGYNTWLIHGRYHSVVLIHMIPVVSSTFLPCHWLYIDYSIDFRPPQLNFKGWDHKGFIYIPLTMRIKDFSVHMSQHDTWWIIHAHYCIYIMTSSNGNIFHVTSLLCGEITGHRWILPAHRPVMRSFDVFFDLCLNRQLGKQWRPRWFEMPSRSLWCHCNAFDQ